MTLQMTKSAPKARPWPPQQGKWTYADYARLPDNGFRYEVIRGELYMSPAPSTRHQAVVTTLVLEMYDFVRQHKLGKVYTSPIDVVIAELATPVQPDLIFISQERLDIVKKQLVEGAPNLVVEVLSPGTVQYDRQTKFYAYAEAGVTEYWLVDPDTCTVDVYVLRGRAYALLGTFGPEDQTQSEVLSDFTLSVGDICSPG